MQFFSPDSWSNNNSRARLSSSSSSTFSPRGSLTDSVMDYYVSSKKRSSKKNNPPDPEKHEPESPGTPKRMKRVTFSADTPFVEDYGIKLSIMKHVFNKDTNCTQYIIKLLYRGVDWVIVKRYNDFVKLHNDIRTESKNWTIRLPSLPKKRWFEKQRWLNRFDDAFGMRRKVELQDYLRSLVRIQTLRARSLAFWQFICMPRMAAEGMKLSNINRNKDGVEVTPPSQPLYSLRHISIEEEMLSTYDREISRDSNCYSDADIIDHVPVEYAELTSGGNFSQSSHLIGNDRGSFNDADDFERGGKYRNSILEVGLGVEFDDEGNVIDTDEEGNIIRTTQAFRNKSVVDEYEKVHSPSGEESNAHMDDEDGEADVDDIAFFDAAADTMDATDYILSKDSNNNEDKQQQDGTAVDDPSFSNAAEGQLTLGRIAKDSDDEVDGLSVAKKPILNRAKNSSEWDINSLSTPQFRIATRKLPDGTFSPKSTHEEDSSGVAVAETTQKELGLEQMDMLTLPGETISSNKYYADSNYEQNLH